jgi:hypothetical protein
VKLAIFVSIKMLTRNCAISKWEGGAEDSEENLQGKNRALVPSINEEPAAVEARG